MIRNYTQRLDIVGKPLRVSHRHLSWLNEYADCLSKTFRVGQRELIHLKFLFKIVDRSPILQPYVLSNV